ncbi:hypothetical protein ACFIOY_04110 [Bradyrhizobium sp. TZ2]
MTRRRLGAMLLAVAITTAAAVNPARAQSAAPAFIDFDWVDSLRSRAVPARLHWPTNIAPGSRVPLIVFSHGMGGSRRGYSYLARYWAARGIASLHVQHAGSDSSLWAGNPLPSWTGCSERLMRARRWRAPGICASPWTACCRAASAPTAPRSTVGVSWRPAIRMAQTRPFLRSARA